MSMRRLQLFLLGVGLLPAAPVWAQATSTPTPVPHAGFSLSLWAREPMLKNPVALSFDDLGRLYVVETARRSTVDIDIRAHQSWIVDDLSNQSIDDLRRFFRTKMAPEKSLENASWLRDYNGDGSHDWRDMLAIKERVHRLEDTQGGGKADRAQVFAEGFNEEVSGVMAGVMPWEKDVFVTVYPDLWRLRDTDGDGKADVTESVFRGFGVHAAFDGHDLHGLTVGPEGKIYFSHGDNGFSVTNREGRALHYPNTGGVLRMNPDGSDLEVFASGLRNPQEIAFDEYGNLFSVDNDGDLADERERFVYITEGSDSGWRLHWQFRDPGWTQYTHQPDYNPWIAERMWVPQFVGQPAHITPALANYSVGPAGFKYNPGSALNESYRRFFFLVQFPVQRITAFQAKPKGAYFEMVNEHLFLSGMMASAVNFSPDGAMFIADWDGMWAPNDKGAIWRMDDAKAAGSELRREVKRLLTEGLRDRPTGELSVLLGHVDLRIRQRAQFELARRREVEPLQKIAQSTVAPQLARIHALWGLGQMQAALAPDQFPFKDADPEIRAQTAKIVGDLRLRTAGTQLIQLLGDESPRVRYHAAMALGKVADPNAVEGLIQLLRANGDADAFLRHAAVMGLAGCASGEALSKLAQHSSVAVRIGAVVALRRQGFSGVAGFLHDADARVRREAVRAIHDDRSIPGAIPALAALIEEPNFLTEEAITRRVLSANLREGTESAARRLVRYAQDIHQSEANRIEAVECLGSWNLKPYLDRVEGLVRVLGERPIGLGDRLIQDNLAGLLVGAGVGGGLTKAVTKVVMENQLAVDPTVFASWVMATNQSVAVRAQALELLAARGFERLVSTLQLALKSDALGLRLTAMRIAASKAPSVLLDFLSSPAQKLDLREQQAAVRLAGMIDAPQAAHWVDERLDTLLAGQLSPELTLDVLIGSRARKEPAIRAKLAAYEAKAAVMSPLANFTPTLHGGDAAAGRDVFRSHPNAQCVRCHEAGGEGFQAGPVLAGVGSRATPEYLLESLIDPSKQIAPGFAMILLETRDGEELDGTKLRETETELTVRLSSGEIRQVSRKEIKKQSTSTQSAMPPMGEMLSLDEIRDVIAYLKSLK